jgi:hypothetical protein
MGGGRFGPRPAGFESNAALLKKGVDKEAKDGYGRLSTKESVIKNRRQVAMRFYVRLAATDCILYYCIVFWLRMSDPSLYRAAWIHAR